MVPFDSGIPSITNSHFSSTSLERLYRNDSGSFLSCAFKALLAPDTNSILRDNPNLLQY